MVTFVYLNVKSPALTLIWSWRTDIIASQTSGRMKETACLEILSKYIREVYESPVARNRSVNSWRSYGDISAL